MIRSVWPILSMGAVVSLSLAACESSTPAALDRKGAEDTAEERADDPADPEPRAQHEPAESPSGSPNEGGATAEPASSAAPSAAATGTAKAASTGDEPTPDPITHPCVVAAARYGVVLGAAPGTCKADGDCACHPGGVTRQTGCGGPTDAKTAKELQAIVAEMASMSCPRELHCGPRPCSAKCVGGRCQ